MRHAVDEDSRPGKELEELEEEAHGQVDPDGVVLAEDPVGHVVQQAPDGGLLQGHGGRQATADQSGPHLPNAVPVPGTGQGGGAVRSKQAVEGSLQQTG